MRATTRGRVWALGMTLWLSLFAAALPRPAHADIYDQIDNAQAQYDNLQSQIATLQAQINAVRGQEAAVRQVIADLDQQIDIVQGELATEQAKYDQLEAQFEDTSAKLDALIKRAAQRQDLLSQRIRAIYKQGEVHYLDLVVSSNSFEDLINNVLDMQVIVHADDLLLQQVRTDRANEAALKAQLSQEKDQEAQVVAQITSQRDLLASKAQDRENALAQLNAQDADLSALRAQAEKAASEVKTQIAQLEQEAAALGAHGTGQFIWPLHGEITQGFGCTSYSAEPYSSSCPPSEHYFHSGIDIANSWGTPIKASDSGAAYTYSTSYGYGNYVIIIHGNGFETLYGHMSSFAIASGTVVAQGQVIGFEGSTGNSSGPHCHFEIRLNNVPQNPLSYLP